MVANIRCAEIMSEQLDAFRYDGAWLALEAEASQDLAPAFGQRAADLMDSCLEGERERRVAVALLLLLWWWRVVVIVAGCLCGNCRTEQCIHKND